MLKSVYEQLIDEARQRTQETLCKFAEDGVCQMRITGRQLSNALGSLPIVQICSLPLHVVYKSPFIICLQSLSWVKMQGIWALALMADAFHLCCNGENLTMSSSYCGALSDWHRTTAALYPFPPGHHSMKDLLGELQTVGLRAVWGSQVFAQEIIKQMLRDAVTTHDLVKGMPWHLSLPLAPPQRQLTYGNRFIQSVLFLCIIFLVFNFMSHRFP